ncbi:MAG: PAS domain-containing protein [Proteobacteria bacterium]|nr:PAS domain-containing protein [Pseudomonadota bacterium]
MYVDNIDFIVYNDLKHNFSNIQMNLSHYIAICNAIVLLLDPLVEIVIHDLKTNKICYINGNLSKREVGDPSLINVAELEQNIDQLTYTKLNFDGRLVKSISVPIDDNILICINCDVSVFTQMLELSQRFVAFPNSSRPDSLFRNDWQERLNLTIHGFLQAHSLQFDNLNGKQKKEAIKYLWSCGAFQEKHAVDYVAKTLGLGRATVFKYLKEWRSS